MNIQIALGSPTNINTFASIELVLPGGVDSCHVKVDYSPLAKVGKNISPELLDLILLACIVYAVDRRISRSTAEDNWTRTFSFTLPVEKPTVWQKIKASVDQCLSFLTGDEWDVNYELRKCDLVNSERELRTELLWDVGAVSLFSGGLDSLVGVVDWLEQNLQSSLVLVGHHDPHIPGPFSDQIGVYNILDSQYPARLDCILTGIGVDSGEDTSLRSRSFLFIALGIYTAHSYSDSIPLLIPENGTMALNIPLSPSRGGSCSTRTVHPFYLSLLREIIFSLGVNNPLFNPLELKTKGECLSECLNQDILKRAIPFSTSCAKRGHKSAWIRRTAKQCGGCIPCIYRRASLHKIDSDTEIYGRDFCNGEININSTQIHTDDLRAYLSFLRKHYSRAELGKLLLLNGKLEVAQLNDYAEVIERACDEVRELLRDKATNEIKRQAGLI
jgi:hypothetical protein